MRLSILALLALAPLAAALELGYYRGILQALDALEAGDSAHAPFVRRMRTLAQQFQFEAMAQHLNGASP